MRKKTWLALAPIAVGLLTVSLYSTQAAESKEVITFQCRLVQDGQPISQSLNLTFEVWDVASGGTEIANRKHTETQAVTVSNGLVSVQLGAGVTNPDTSLPNPPISGVFSQNASLWVAVKQGTTDLLGSRVKLTAVPYSMSAARAEVLWDPNTEQSFYPSSFVLSTTTAGQNTTVVGQAGTLILQASETHVSSGTVILHGTIEIPDALEVGTIEVSDALKVGDMVELAHASTPATVTTNHVALYAKSDGKLYYKPHNGTETEVGGGASSSGTVLPHVAEGRLSGHSTDPVGETSSSGSSTIYYHRHSGDKLAIHDGSDWEYVTIPSGGVSLALSGTGVRDVFAHTSSNAPVLSVVNWDSTTSRGTGKTLDRQDGAWVKNGDSTRRYLGTIYVASGVVKDLSQFRDVWNLQNQIARRSASRESVYASNYTGGTGWGVLGTSADWTHSFVIGLPHCVLNATSAVQTSQATSAFPRWGISLDSSTGAPGTDSTVSGTQNGTHTVSVVATYAGKPGIGRHSIYAVFKAGVSGNYIYNTVSGTNVSGLQSVDFR